VHRAHRRPLGIGQVPVAPLADRDEHRVQVEALLGEPVLLALALAGLLVRHPAKDPGGDEHGQPVDLTTKFLRPVTVESGLLRCEGSVLSQGRRTALAEARLADAAGRFVAHATSSCLLFPLSG
jgi:hypothetical protein